MTAPIAGQNTVLSSSRSSPYRFGVIGCGARGETFARQLFAGGASAQLAGVCDVDGDRLHRFIDYCGLKGTRSWTDPEAFLSDPQVDGVIVTTPEFTHADVAVRALELNKHVYMEKPLAHTVADCQRIVRAATGSSARVMMGFNLRALPAYQKLHQVMRSGVLGRIVHISALEQLSFDHGAAFMRRWHRRASRSGGLLNTKCSHDLDILQWLIGHEHKVTRIASFGGNNVFNAQPAPAPRCSVCPQEIQSNCAYRDRAGFVFPIYGEPAYKKQDEEIYGNDLCVYTADKDIVDNQTLILEWDHGVRGSFNLQMFSHEGLRTAQVWGERGTAILRQSSEPSVEVIDTATGDRTMHRFVPRPGGHGGADLQMLRRFIDTIEGRLDGESGLLDGLAATLLAARADESRLGGKTVEIDPREFSR